MPTPAGEPHASRKWAASSDGDCIERVGRGSVEAFEEILSRYQRRVVNLTYRIVGDWDAALDLGQETFVRIHRRAVTFRPEGNACAWILTIAVNAARDYLRARARIVYLDPTAEPGSREGTLRAASERERSTPSEALEREEVRERVRAVVGQMQEFQRTVLLLRDFEGLAYEEIALVMECEVGTVKSRIHRARKQFEEIWARLP